jgi:hypothetical protein
VKAVAITAEEIDPLAALDRLNTAIGWSADEELVLGLKLARDWLDEERAFEVFRKGDQATSSALEAALTNGGDQ